MHDRIGSKDVPTALENDRVGSLNEWVASGIEWLGSFERGGVGDPEASWPDEEPLARHPRLSCRDLKVKTPDRRGKRLAPRMARLEPEAAWPFPVAAERAIALTTAAVKASPIRRPPARRSPDR